MPSVLLALRRAARDLTAPRMFTLLIWPMGLALLFWGTLAWWFGSAWRADIALLLAGTPLDSLARWAGADWLTAYAALFVLVLLWLPAVYVTALVITSVAFMPVIVDFVAKRDYADLQPRHGGTLWGGVVNSVIALLLFLTGWLLLMPLWLFAPFGAVLSLMLNAWLNQRMFVYDTLAEHADRAELEELRRAGGWRLYTLSALLGALHLVPLLNLLAPVYMGLAFTHYCLDALRRRREGA